MLFIPVLRSGRLILTLMTWRCNSKGLSTLLLGRDFLLQSSAAHRNPGVSFLPAVIHASVCKYLSTGGDCRLFLELGKKRPKDESLSLSSFKVKMIAVLPPLITSVAATPWVCSGIV